MAKIIFGGSDLNTNIQPNLNPIAATGFISERDYLKKRSKKYIDLVCSLDHKTLNDTIGLGDLLEAIKEEFGSSDLTSFPLGIVSKCFLGHPYEVHILDLSATQIIEHFKISEMMPAQFENARALAKHNAYAMVEVYKDKLVLIRHDGTATKLKS